VALPIPIAIGNATNSEEKEKSQPSKKAGGGVGRCSNRQNDKADNEEGSQKKVHTRVHK
jgi:hypothetical protein